MRVKWQVGGEPLLDLADSTLDVIPRVTDQVDLPDGITVYVGSVNWYPWGEPDDVVLEPFVYVVLERSPVPDPMMRLRPGVLTQVDGPDDGFPRFRID